MSSISFIVPTAGRPSIEVCLASIVPYLYENDEVIVVGDITDGPLPLTQEIVASFGSKARYLEGPKTEHSWGHREINYGISQAKGEWLSFNDDDDIWTPEAATLIHKATDELQSNPRPILFRFLTYHGFIAWTSRTAFMQDQVGGHCIIAPNIHGKVGKWGDHYQGDWSFIYETVSLHGGPASIVWREELIAIARPPVPVIEAVMQTSTLYKDLI